MSSYITAVENITSITQDVKFKHRIAPVLEELAGKHADVDFVKVDIDNQEITPVVVENNVTAVPTFVSMRGEKKLTTFSGADKNQLLRMVQEVSEL